MRRSARVRYCAEARVASMLCNFSQEHKHGTRTVALGGLGSEASAALVAAGCSVRQPVRAGRVALGGPARTRHHLGLPAGPLAGPSLAAEAPGSIHHEPAAA